MRRRPLSVVLLSIIALLAGCRREPPAEPVATDPEARLSQLLRRGAQPGELTLAEREEVERLLLPLLPASEGDLAGYTWRVIYNDLPGADFVAVDLLQGEGSAASRAMWFHLFWRRAGNDGDLAAYRKAVDRWPARGVDGHHLFVRAGRVELRAVADRDDFRDAARIEAVVAGFDLAALSRL
jgi:hypothetical protein